MFGKIDDPEFYDLCLLGVCTGLRSGELLGLKWGDVDNPEGFIRVDSRQKNKRESRIPINSGAQALLHRCHGRGRPGVFRRWKVDRVSRIFKKYARAAGLNVRFHDIRHTLGPLLAMAGRQGKDVQDLMRHASFASTLVYAKLFPDHLKEASEWIHVPLLPAPQSAPRKKPHPKIGRGKNAF